MNNVKLSCFKTNKKGGIGLLVAGSTNPRLSAVTPLDAMTPIAGSVGVRVFVADKQEGEAVVTETLHLVAQHSAKAAAGAHEQNRAQSVWRHELTCVTDAAPLKLLPPKTNFLL